MARAKKWRWQQCGSRGGVSWCCTWRGAPRRPSARLCAHSPSCSSCPWCAVAGAEAALDARLVGAGRLSSGVKGENINPRGLAGAGLADDRVETSADKITCHYAPGVADDGVRTSTDSTTRRLASGLYTRAQITCHRTLKAHNARHRHTSPCRVHAATGTYTNTRS
jgi:hypothetical protein